MAENIQAGIASINNSNLPYSFDAEQAVLGSVLLESRLMAEITDKLNPTHFHVGLHNEIFSVMTQMFITGLPIDIVTVVDETVKKDVFDSQADAKVYLAKLMDSAISPSSIESYAKIIVDKYMVRQLMYASNEILNLASAGSEEPKSLLDFAETKIYDIRSEKDITGLMPIKPTVLEKIKELSEISADPAAYQSKYLSTSFSRLDEIIYGLAPADLIIVAGRPGMGKTTFAVNIAIGFAKRYRDKKVAVFSFEMSRGQLVERLLSSEARITSDQMRKGDIDRNGWKNIASAAEFLSGLEVYIDDTPNISLVDMKAKLRRMKNIGVVVIDYLQLMSLNRRDMNRVQEISDITRNLKILAKELNVAVILASQLSREVEKRLKAHADSRPMMADLRDSGSIEQDADIVLMLHREAVYNDATEFPNRCECLVEKNRRGRTGTVYLNFRGEYYSFTDEEYIHVSEG